MELTELDEGSGPALVVDVDRDSVGRRVAWAALLVVAAAAGGRGDEREKTDQEKAARDRARIRVSTGTER